MGLRILPSARKHGYDDPDIRHALQFQMFRWPPQENGCEMIVGPSKTGALMEIGIVRSDDDTVVIHADRARDKFLRPRR